MTADYPASRPAAASTTGVRAAGASVAGASVVGVSATGVAVPAGAEGRVVDPPGAVVDAPGAVDWSTTPLGAPQAWPASLRTAVRIAMASPLPMAVLWGPSLLQVYNEACRPLLGPRHPAGLGRPVLETWPEFRDLIEPPCRQVLAGGAPVLAQDRPWALPLDARASTRWFTTSFSALPDDAGGTGGVLVTVVDATERVRAERESARMLAHSRDVAHELVRLFDQAPGFVAVLRGPDHVFDLVSEAYHQLVGHRDLVGRPVREALPEVAGQGFFELLDTVYRTGRPHAGYAVPVALRRLPGGPLTRMHVDFVYQPILEPDGSVSGIFVQGHDVTERVRAAEELRRASALLQAVGEATPTFLYLKDRAGRMLYCNRAVLDALGKPAEEVIGRTDAEFSGAGPHTDAIVAHDRQVMESGASFVGEERIEGTDRIFLSTKTPYRDADGSVIGLAGVSVDISAQRRVEQALADSEELFRLAVESSSLGTFDYRPPTGLMHWSPSAWRFHGLVGEGSVPLEVALERVHPEDRARLQALLARMLDAGGPREQRYQHRIVRPDGEVRWLDAMAQARFAPDADGVPRPLRITGVVWDITAQQRLVDSLREADARKDEFLAMLAHELRNPLAPLTNALRFLGRSLPLAGEHGAALAMAERQTRQLTRLVDDLLEISRITRGKIELRREPMTVQAAVHDAVGSVAASIEARRQRLRLELPAEPLRIVADPARVAQVLENLLHNASKYTLEGRAIRVELRRVEPRGDGQRGDGPVAEIRVIDDGMGIEPAKIPHLFELFSQLDTTLDRAAGGLGIGLALVRRLVELHGGTVAAASDGPGKGATFTVRLPA